VELDRAFLNVLGINISDKSLLLLYSQIGSSLTQWMGS